MHVMKTRVSEGERQCPHRRDTINTANNARMRLESKQTSPKSESSTILAQPEIGYPAVCHARHASFHTPTVVILLTTSS